MKSLKQAGVFSSGRWGRWGLCFVFSVAVAGCGGGSDPLDVNGGSSDGGGSTNLRAAYDRITCGMTIQEAEKAVGRKADLAWVWQAEYWTPDTEELEVTATIPEGDSSGVLRAVEVEYDHPRNGISLHRDLCR